MSHNPQPISNPEHWQGVTDRININAAIWKLREAIRMKDRREILAAYKSLESVEWEKFPGEFPEYEPLIDQANAILYS